MPRRVSDIVAVALCWGSGGALVAAMAAILGWVAYQGASRLDWSFATTYPAPGSLEEGVRGGVLSPLVGTLILILIGSAIALPIGVGTAVFLTEYRRPALLYRLADTSIDLIFGVPSVVLALFGLAFFQHSWLVLLSGKVQSSGQASGQSYLTAGIVISLIALPPIVRSTQSSILSVPTSHREGSYALGKGRLATLRKVVIPGARQGVVTGLILGIVAKPSSGIRTAGIICSIVALVFALGWTGLIILDAFAPGNGPYFGP